MSAVKAHIKPMKPPPLIPKKVPSSEGLSSKDPVQGEPKTYFANERTFIQWISAALLLLTVSSIMLGSGNYNGTSSVIAFSSLVPSHAGVGYEYLSFAFEHTWKIHACLPIKNLHKDGVPASPYELFFCNKPCICQI